MRTAVFACAGAAAIVAIEGATRSQARYGPECVVAAIAVWWAWRHREELDSRFVVAFAVALPAAVASVQLARHAAGDIDVQTVYPAEGHQLLTGTYPHSEYPPGAVVLFAAEEWLRSPRDVNPYAMALCSGAIAWAICALRTPSARWIALALVLWPVNAFFWEYKFDALPTALLVLGAAAATRQRETLAGLLLGVGAAVKWSPAIAAVLFVIWLLARRETVPAWRHTAGFVIGFGAIVFPFLVWSPGAVWASVSRQAPRGVTAESIWYLPLRLVSRERVAGPIYAPLETASWANTVAVSIQVAVLAGLIVLLVVRRPDRTAAVALALAGAMLFLLLNKVFSAQYALTIASAGAFAAALERRAGPVAALLAVACAANVLVYPIGRFWVGASLTLFATALAAVALLVRAPLTTHRYPRTS